MAGTAFTILHRSLVSDKPGAPVMVTANVRVPSVIFPLFMKEFVPDLFVHTICKPKNLKTVLWEVQNEPYVPPVWRSHKSTENYPVPLTGYDHSDCTENWLEARNACVEYAKNLVEIAAYDAEIIPLLQPWSTVTVLTSAHELYWHNLAHALYVQNDNPAMVDLSNLILDNLQDAKLTATNDGETEDHLRFHLQKLRKAL